jgi:hypothetical protein
MDPGGCSGSGYMDCWNKYWAWTKTDDFKTKMWAIASAPDFTKDNYMAAEFRVPVTLLQTNACSPLATNAIRDNIWDNFSSETYKQLPSVGEITVYDPFTGAPKQYKMPAGGRGYTRPASLISMWSTAPYLLNNAVGKFNPSPSVEARMDSFQDSIKKMLWPELRQKDSVLGDKIPGTIDRITQRSYLRIARGFVPDNLEKLIPFGQRTLPSVFGEGGIEVGPIPTGTPIDLLANLNLLSEDTDPAARAAHDAKVLDLALRLKHDLEALPANATEDDARKVFANLAQPLMDLSKCPDYIVNRGHYFGTSMLKEEPALTDAEKNALIEFLKTL